MTVLSYMGAVRGILRRKAENLKKRGFKIMATKTPASGKKDNWTDGKGGTQREKMPPNPVFRFWGYEKKDGTKVEANGAELIGLLVTKRAYYDDAGDEKMFYVVKDDKEKTWTIFGTAVLDRRMKNKAEGSRVKISYHGKEKNEWGGQTHLFEVLVSTPF